MRHILTRRGARPRSAAPRLARARDRRQLPVDRSAGRVARAVLLVGHESGRAARPGHRRAKRRRRLPRHSKACARSTSRRASRSCCSTPICRRARRRVAADSRDAQPRIGMPVLVDETQLIGESLGLKRNGEVLIANPQGWKVDVSRRRRRCSRGARLDARGQQPSSAAASEVGGLPDRDAGARQAAGARADLVREDDRTAADRQVREPAIATAASGRGRWRTTT